MREAIDSAAAAPDYTPVMLAKLRMLAAGIELKRGARDAARKLLDQALPVFEASLPADAPERAKAQELLKKTQG
ncbi:MAG: hypothetical protein ACREP7_17950, partial [Lysobacter sp.]